MENQKYQNSLINETSPYLLQHANNPVDWYPWGDKALSRAREENKPILLSIGYSACHWCHVMAHESFEDEATANTMNEHFINIKVDREERPDLDKIYQTAQQLLTQRTGGWPLTMFLSPESHIPFFGGTYFPPTSRFGLPGFKDLLLRVYQYYQTEREAIEKQNHSLKETFEKMADVNKTPDDVIVDEEPLAIALQQLEQSFDKRHGGFGAAPKFPHPTNLELLLRSCVRNKNNDTLNNNALAMLDITLHKMAEGGIYDQLGGGFSRYSVDERWMIPHFEKMLYDNGPLLSLYCQSWQVTNDPFFKTVATETADWVMRDMQDERGGYYSTLDADSEGEEGKFYVWTREQIQSLLSDKEFELCSRYYGLNDPPNFEGKWHLRIVEDLGEVAEALSIKKNEAESLIYQIKLKLLAERNKRIWPGRDEKLLTSWNALMIKGMATAAVTFDREDYLKSATDALEFIRDAMWQNGRLVATYKDGKGHLNAYLDDYAFLIDAILVLLEGRWNNDWLNFAINLAEILIEYFEDKQEGGFFFTSHDHEQLIQRSKPYMDDSVPAGNGIAAYALGRLGHLLGNNQYLTTTERVLRSSWSSIERFPSAHNALLLALEEFLSPPQSIIIRGNEKEMVEWRNICRENQNPFRTVLCIPSSEEALPELLAQRKPQAETVAYICSGHHCQAPVLQLDLLAENLNNP